LSLDAKILLGVGLVAAALFLAGLGAAPFVVLSSVDVAARNIETRGGQLPFLAAAQTTPLLRSVALALGLAAAGAALGLALRRPVIGLGAVLAAMLAFLPISAEGFSLFARGRSVRPLGQAVAIRAAPADVLAHEGPLENSAAWLMDLDRPVKVVNGLESSLAFGATFPEARRVFLLTGLRPETSVVQRLPAGTVHLIQQGGGRWLYSNRP
jgi:hypothetical protein